MESSDRGDLAVALAELRPRPQADFAAELDRRAAAGFPPSSRFAGLPLAAALRRLARPSPRQLYPAIAGGALAAIAVSTVIVASNESQPAPVAFDNPPAAAERHHHVQFSAPAPRAVGKPSDNGTEAAGSAGIGFSDVERLSSAAGNTGAELRPFSRNLEGFKFESRAASRNREIERSAEISLLAAPADVAEDSADVFAAVHDADGIVLHSTTSSGKGAGARFDLLIPSAQLGDALAAFSAIDEVRSRHEATDDITAPTVSAREELQDSRARIDTLLAQLAGAETESEALAVEAELRSERRHTARLRARLANLDRRTTYSRVSVRIESDAAADSNGTWGIGDAFGDAGHILGIAAGVTLVGLAVLTPLALLFLLVWLARSTWLRHARARALT